MLEYLALQLRKLDKRQHIWITVGHLRRKKRGIILCNVVYMDDFDK
jgi:hypothetical protein